MDANEWTERVIGAAIEVHRGLGPGLLESAYRQCLCREMSLREIPFVLERPLPVTYKGMVLECGYRTDLLVADMVAVELKSIEKLLPIHETQLLTYLRQGNWQVGLLINFNATLLKEGVVRRVNGYKD